LSTEPYRPATLPRNFASVPTSYPSGLLRLQLHAAQRYLFDGELKEIMEAASLPLDLLNTSASDIPVTVAQLAIFAQGLRAVTGDARARDYGREAFMKASPLIPRPPTSAVNPMARAVSDKDKLFLRIRDVMHSFNRPSGANVIVKWHGGSESELFEDTGQHCYGFRADEPCCQTLTGFLEAAVEHLSGIHVELVERECMATGALACRWHCKLV